MGIQVIGHTSFLGHTGYNSHSRNFFTHLDKYIPTRVRNYTYASDLSYLKPEEYKLIIQQNLDGHPNPVGLPFNPNPKDLIVNIVLNESHHYFFYDQYDHPMIAYNVWESTKQLPEYFNRILQYDQFWCPTEWQRMCTIAQGYPEDRVKIVHEGVNGNIFCPDNNVEEKNKLYDKYNIPHDAFVYMIFGRWDYRKSTKEMIESWKRTMGDKDNCYLIISADNPFSSDGMKTTEERLKHYKFEHDRIRILHFPPRDEYIKWMKYGSCLISCSRSEGWNLPLMEALACGTPSICSDWGGPFRVCRWHCV
jgi:glycosyltransferase involved in cell wall biosynthesis